MTVDAATLQATAPNPQAGRPAAAPWDPAADPETCLNTAEAIVHAGSKDDGYVNCKEPETKLKAEWGGAAIGALSIGQTKAVLANQTVFSRDEQIVARDDGP